MILKVFLKKLAGGRDRPMLHWQSKWYNPVLTLWQPQALCKSRAKHNPPCPPHRYSCSHRICNQSLQEAPCSTEEADYTFYIKILLLI